MKTLDEHNRQRTRQYLDTKWPIGTVKNGIACPKCGAELLDSKPTETLLSNPPQKNVNCDECGYVGYRIA